MFLISESGRTMLQVQSIDAVRVITERNSDEAKIIAVCGNHMITILKNITEKEGFKVIKEIASVISCAGTETKAIKIVDIIESVRGCNNE